MSSPSSKTRDWSADDLERAAKYMRELDSSSNAKVAFELAKREQDVEIAKSRASEKEHEAHRASALSNLERVRAEEARKTMEAKRENEKVRKRSERCVRAHGSAVRRIRRGSHTAPFTTSTATITIPSYTCRRH